MRSLVRRLGQTKHAERAGTALSGKQSGIVLVRDLEQGIAVADAYAAEHLEIHTARAPEVARRIRSAGAIFVGPTAPCRWGTIWRAPTMCCPQVARRASVRG